MTEKDYLKYWQETAQEDLRAAQDLFKDKHYHHSLFFCHLALEKLIKGLVYKNIKQHASPIHDLEKLIKQGKIGITEEQKRQIEEISTWNIRARYDNVKRDFYKKATQEFTAAWFIKIRKLFVWLKKQY